MNEEMWTTKDGKQILISEMTDQHLINAINYLDRRLKILCEEANKRKLDLEPDPISYDQIYGEAVVGDRDDC